MTWPTNRSVESTKHFKGCDPEAVKIVVRMLALDPSQRPSARDLLCERWFW